MSVFVLHTHNGNAYYVDEHGYMLARSNGPRGWAYGKGWQIVGLAKRWNARMSITLTDAASGVDFGHGYVHDIDHGTRRIWGERVKMVRTVADDDAHLRYLIRAAA